MHRIVKGKPVSFILSIKKYILLKRKEQLKKTDEKDKKTTHHVPLF